MIQTNAPFRMSPLVPSPSSAGNYAVTKASGCHYRDWVMVERPNGIYATRDNLNYVLVMRRWGSRDETIKRFRALVDEREGAANE